jgi:hypothetical protein
MMIDVHSIEEKHDPFYLILIFDGKNEALSCIIDPLTHPDRSYKGFHT